MGFVRPFRFVGKVLTVGTIVLALSWAAAPFALAQSKAPATKTGRPTEPKEAPPAKQEEKPITQEAQPAKIEHGAMLILVRSALLALHHANLTGNYTVLRDLGSPSFQNANSAARLSEIFTRQRAGNLDLYSALLLEPQLKAPPDITPNGLLHIVGSFPASPQPVSFELWFEQVDNQLKIMGISVNSPSP